MDRVSLKRVPVRPASPWKGAGRIVRGGLLAAFTVVLAWNVLLLWFPQMLPGNADQAAAILLLSGACAGVACAARQLPLQNVLLAVSAISGVVLMVILLNSATGIPFGPWSGALFQTKQQFWVWPLIWVVFLVNSRGVAALLLRRGTRTTTHGYRMLGLTVLLAFMLEINLEPFATTVRHFWSWQPTRVPVSWYGTSVLALWGWAMTAFVASVLMVPAVINKSPVEHPPGAGALWIWAGANLLFAAGGVRNHLWPAVALSMTETVLVVAAAGFLRTKAEDQKDEA